MEQKTVIIWDSGEKFYEYVDWIKYLIDKILKPRGYVVNGLVDWQGEEFDDRGKIIVFNNVVKVKTDDNNDTLMLDLLKYFDSKKLLTPEEERLLKRINENV